ncbi:MAG: ATP synthase subunit I [Acidimicrobiia bacterium]
MSVAVPVELAVAPEPLVARDIARRALPFVPVLVLAGLLGWGPAGAASVGYAVAIVVANLLLAAWMLATAARISYGLLMAAALFGFLLRLGLVSVAVLAVRDAGWVEPVPLGLALVVTHLGLLLWEMRFVSISLAHPDLKPTPKETTPR